MDIKYFYKIFFLFSLTYISYGDIIINEFAAATSDRNLKYSADGTPSVGSGLSWSEILFDDSSWNEAPGGFGYGDDYGGTEINIQNIAYSLYIRQTFVVDAATASRADALEFSVDYDDSFVAFLNGKELIRKNLGPENAIVFHDQHSYNSHESSHSGSQESFVCGVASNFIVEGTNVLAIQTHNVTLGSSDLIIIADLKISGLPEINLVNHTNFWKYFVGKREPSGGLTDPRLLTETNINDNFVDWLELYNSSPTSVNLKGWVLTDDKSELEKWIFPDVTISAGDYLIVFCNGENITSSFLHTNFKLSKNGEYLALLDNASPRNIISEFAPSYPKQSFFHSYGWSEASNSYLYFSNFSPGNQNSGETFFRIVDTPIVDKDPGFYSGVTVAITSTTQNAEIRYTTNGSEPTENSALYLSPLTFNFNTALRVKTFKIGWIPSKTVTRTYLLYANDAIRNAPIVSIVADSEKSIFKPNGVTAIVGGIWNSGWWSAQNPDDFNIPMQRGRPYERPLSIEFLYYYTNLWKQIDCGFRIAGSDWTRPQYILQDLTGKWNQHPHINKPQFNVYFRSDYGESILNFPIIPDSVVTKFDSLRLRGGKNDWYNPFIIDEFVRRIAINMGQVGSKGFLAWLFVNGEQKGFFNPVERLDQKFFQEWYDSKENWDILNHGGISEGDDIAWNEMLSYFNSHNLDNLTYYIEAAKTLDLVNYIDYIIAESYGGNWDWPNNNWYASHERSTNGLFRFYVWDAEGSFFNGNDIYVDSFNQNPSYMPDGGAGLNGENTPIAEIYRALKNSSEFRLLFADRIQKHYFDDGAMVEANLVQTWQELEDIMAPMFSSFFGGSLDVRTRTQWIPQRGPYVFQQFKNEGLWPDTSAPYFNQHGGSITSGFNLIIYNTNSAGTIYYSTDGTDPRQLGGGINGTSFLAPVSLTKTTKIKARILNSGEWSPLSEATFFVTGAQKIVVTEMMYHPPGGEEFEFIELKNVSGYNLDISKIAFVDGITFSFEECAVTNLLIDDYVVVVKSNSAFAMRYNTNDILIAGEFDGGLKNSSERIELKGEGNETLLEFTYSDSWYPTTDGNGYSLVIADELANTNMWNLKVGWRPSLEIYGSPGKEDIPEPSLFIIYSLLSILYLLKLSNYF